MIIITPEKFNKFNLLPSRFEYFSLNPEINQLCNLQKVELENLFSSDYLNRLISFQKELYFTANLKSINPKLIGYSFNAVDCVNDIQLPFSFYVISGGGFQLTNYEISEVAKLEYGQRDIKIYKCLSLHNVDI